MTTEGSIQLLGMVQDGEKIKKTSLKKTKWPKIYKTVLSLIFLLALAVFISSIRLSSVDQSQTSIISSVVAKNQNEAETETRKRNLSVWTANCCPTTQKCGMFIEDCCKIDTRGCNWFFFCYQKADDQNCRRVRSIVKKLDGYWAI